mmetsp:Transcript_34757/g.74035  ORF Transcript_34757/g.74035 Transcript_34757/m.74035 type:complete len:90 (+) Transcript_34757:1174-1443(+)
MILHACQGINGNECYHNDARAKENESHRRHFTDPILKGCRRFCSCIPPGAIKCSFASVGSGELLRLVKNQSKSTSLFNDGLGTLLLVNY